MDKFITKVNQRSLSNVAMMGASSASNNESKYQFIQSLVLGLLKNNLNKVNFIPKRTRSDSSENERILFDALNDNYYSQLNSNKNSVVNSKVKYNLFNSIEPFGKESFKTK